MAKPVEPDRLSIRRYLNDSGSDIRQLCIKSMASARDHWKPLAAFMAVILVLAAALKPFEMDILERVQSFKPSDGLVYQIARQISFWGDYHTGTLILSAILWCAGFFRHSAQLRNAALVCLLAAGLAGLFTDIFRYGLGRARPNAGVEDGLYGFSLSSKFHGFPSGHTTTAFGTAVPIAILFPPLAVPSLAVAASVGWSRLYLNYHRPTDVLVGAGVGISFGMAFGLATRRKCRSESDAKHRT
ncbi:MAG: phosphatase PAP2 family protein [Methylococcaceae bacterium]|nr:phosphatase PAP2 family protein [Methylococcaceae bacterium]